MPAAPFPSNESDRIAELLRYDILDTAAEDSFDGLTKIASYICQVPVSLISLVDTHRQWFKSKVGLDVSETPRELAFCGYTILGDEPCIINDATTDKRVKDNQLVLDNPNIRFYAGCPLVSPRGFRLGSFCVIDFIPRDLSPSQLDCLKTLAKQAVLLLEERINKRKIAEYTRSLETAKQQAEQANQAKSLFLATISHEIRTPLNGVVGMLQLLSESDLETQQLDFINTAKASASTLLSIISDVLDFSKIESGKTELTPQAVNLGSVLEDIRLILSPKATEKQLNLNYDYDAKIPEFLMVDADRLRQILLNLCGNAIKFTPPQGTVTVTIRLVDSTPEVASVEVRVADTGVGIPTAQQQSILEPFTQVSSDRGARQEGTGLGLTITNRLLRLMDAQLSISSAPHEGACFSFVLHCPISGCVPKPLASLSSPPQPLRILVAEDHPVNQKVITAVLQRRGHDVRVVSNGLDAVQQYQAETFDLILLDLQMPIMGGEEAAQQIRKLANGLGHTIPIVALTAHVFTEFKERAMNHMDGYLSKPLCLEELDKVIAAAAIKKQPA
ncbi:MAG: response regulator [Leptolyngbya sp. SIO1E4]|nr:response regulator [Leptolyngbya sp. SIO1E4]